MKLAVFDSHSYDRAAFDAANRDGRHQLTFLEPRLTALTARLAEGHGGVVSFVNDVVDAAAIRELARAGVRLIALRCAGYDHVDVNAAREAGIAVVRVPAYSPHAVAEHAIALLLSAARKTHRGIARVREWNFRLDGLVGFDLYGKTAGIVGTGNIGTVAAEILLGFGCKVVAFDREPNPALVARGVRYLPLEELLAASDIVSLHVPLNASTKHLLNRQAIERMKRGAVLINTGRGGLVDTAALIEALKTGHVAAAGLDVYEREAGLFFEDRSAEIVQDDALARLLSFPNVVMTGHQAFLTHEALEGIASTTLGSASAFERGEPLACRVG